MNLKQLIEKYNVPAPRYSCYPAPQYWEGNNRNQKRWLKTLKNVINAGNPAGLDLYIHMPFCDSLCTFCGYDKRITKNHFVEEIYIDALIRQWKIYLQNFEESPAIMRLHMGGGTPAFFSPKNLERLFSELMPTLNLTDDCEISFEAHPASASYEHLQTLYDFGFRTIRLGVQDFNENVLRTINRIQNYGDVKNSVEQARQIGYKRIVFDLIYGLPYQTLETVEDTIKKAIDFKPDAIAYYSYIHVPNERPSQKKFKESWLPQGVKKINLFDTGSDILQKAGYLQIGLDHFATKNDLLSKALQKGKLRRTFSGYTHFHSDALLGLGAIAISDIGAAYAQNMIGVEEFHEKVFSNSLPIQRTHYSTEEDILLKEFINDVMCYGKAKWSQEIFDSLNPDAKYEVIQIQKEGLIEVDRKGFIVTETGRPFLRNISMIFDARRHRSGQRYDNEFSGAI